MRPPRLARHTRPTLWLALLTAALVSACAPSPATPDPAAAGPMPTREQPATIPSPDPALPYTIRCGAHAEATHSKPWRLDAASLDRALATGPLASACLDADEHKPHLSARHLRDAILACQARVAGGNAYFELNLKAPQEGRCWGILVSHQQGDQRWIGLSLSAGADYATALHAIDLSKKTAQPLYHGAPWMELACMSRKDQDALSPADRSDTAKATSFSPEQQRVWETLPKGAQEGVCWWGLE